MANTYRFKTIMVHDYDRHKFTCMRDRCAKAAGVRVTDKDLYAAIADSMNPAMVEELVVARAKEVVALRAQAKLEKLQAKVNAKLEALNQAAEPEELEDEASEEVAV
jgi:BMFP domain-containing protein YqiC